MEWAPDSPDPWAPDSRHPDLWATDSRGRLTLGRAVELFLGAKAAEGASPRTTEWYRMILARLIRSLGSDRSVDGLDPAEARIEFWRRQRLERLLRTDPATYEAEPPKFRIHRHFSVYCFTRQSRIVTRY
jgi:hypothetical protein